jgi:MoaA/NifB/PqqE/SkfB family radical SAM enzyme
MKRFYEDHLSIFTTSKCSNECNFCLCSSSPSKHTFITPERIEDVIKDYSGKWKELSIGGGEPTLHPRIIEIIDLAIKYKWDVLFHTNGRDPEVVKNVIDRFRDTNNSINITVSYNSEVTRQNPEIIGNLKKIEGMCNLVNSSFKINVFDIEHWNSLIDLGFTMYELEMYQIIKAGRGVDYPGARDLPDMADKTGDILCSDGELFTIDEYIASCTYQSNLD